MDGLIACVMISYPTGELQAEFFLLKFGHKGVDRKELYELLTQFQKFDKRHKGELEEDEAMMLLESRNSTKTFRELRQMVTDIDFDQNRELSFLEWACAIKKQEWKALHAPSIDPEELAKAAELQAQAAAALEAAAAKRDAAEKEALEATYQKEIALLGAEQALKNKEAHVKAIADRKEAERVAAEKAAAERATALSSPGVKGAAAKFFYAAKDSEDATADNASRIKGEAAARKEAKRLEAEKKKSDEEAAAAAVEADAAAERRRAQSVDTHMAEAAAALAFEERKKIESGSEASRVERERYEAEKAATAEADAAKKKADDEDRAARRAKMAERGNLWGGAK